MGTIKPTLRLRKLGLALRAHREAAGLTLEVAAKLLKRSASGLSRIEKGLHHTPERDVEYMLNKYGVTDPIERERLFALSRHGRKKGWWQLYRSDLSAPAMELISLEADALAINSVDLHILPGLMQSRSYARSLINIGPFSNAGRQVDRLVAIRMKRQEILWKPTPPQVHAIVSEAAVRQQVGGDDVMRGQLHQLLELSALPHITVQVLPFSSGAHKGADGSFKIIRVAGPGSLDVVALDSLTQISYLETEAELSAYTEAFEQVRVAALDETDSRATIEGLMSSHGGIRPGRVAQEQPQRDPRR